MTKHSLTATWSACSGETRKRDGALLPVALKKVSFQTQLERKRAKAELLALKEARGGPHLLQCYGAWEYWCPTEHKQYLWVATE